MKKLFFITLFAVLGIGARAQSLYLVNVSPCDAYVSVTAHSSVSYPAACSMTSALVTIPAGGTISFTGPTAYLAFQAAYPWAGNPGVPSGETVTWDAFSYQFGTCPCGSGGGAVSLAGACGATASPWNNGCRGASFFALGGGSVQLFIN